MEWLKKNKFTQKNVATLCSQLNCPHFCSNSVNLAFKFSDSQHRQCLLNYPDCGLLFTFAFYVLLVSGVPAGNPL